MHALETYSSFKLKFMQKLTNLYNKREQELLFFLALDYLKNWSKVEYTLYKNEEMDLVNLEKFNKIIFALKEGKPIQYILGKTHFYGLEIMVNQYTLIPRPETEELVSLAKAQIPQNNQINVLDIGTGSGCIILALKSVLKNISAFALDYSREAIEMAEKNADNLNLEVNFLHDNILDPKLTYPKFDYIISNPPYIPEGESIKMSKQVINYEPRMALFVDDNNALVFYTSILAFADKNLTNKGKIFFEIHENFGNQVLNLMENKSYKNIELISDLQGKKRFIIAEKFE